MVPKRCMKVYVNIMVTLMTLWLALVPWRGAELFQARPISQGVNLGAPYSRKLGHIGVGWPGKPTTNICARSDDLSKHYLRRSSVDSWVHVHRTAVSSSVIASKIHIQIFGKFVRIVVSGT